MPFDIIIRHVHGLKLVVCLFCFIIKAMSEFGPFITNCDFNSQLNLIQMYRGSWLLGSEARNAWFYRHVNS